MAGRDADADDRTRAAPNGKIVIPVSVALALLGMVGSFASHRLEKVGGEDALIQRVEKLEAARQVEEVSQARREAQVAAKFEAIDAKLAAIKESLDDLGTDVKTLTRRGR